jgi:hypothetical protein
MAYIGSEDARDPQPNKLPNIKVVTGTGGTGTGTSDGSLVNNRMFDD